jgi:hypothetical protein
VELDGQEKMWKSLDFVSTSPTSSDPYAIRIFTLKGAVYDAFDTDADADDKAGM